MEHKPNQKQFNEEEIISFLQGKLPLDKIEMLGQWIEESEENRKYFEDIRNIWLGTIVKAGKQFNESDGWNIISGKLHEPTVLQLYEERHKTEMKLNRIFRKAAILLLVFSLGFALSWHLASNTSLLSTDHLNEVIVPQGSKSHLVLPDGSNVWLNAGSRLTYDDNFNRNERIVKLEGEAFFKVTSNKKKPFIVETSHLNVKAYGTAFNVKSYPDDNEIVTTLVEGKVTVEGTRKEFTYSLEPNQNMTYIKSLNIIMDYSPESKAESKETEEPVVPLKSVKRVKVDKHIKTKLYTSWKDENWIIEGERLKDFATDLERRYNTKIEFGSEEIKGYRFTGTIQNETLEQVLEILRMTAPIKYEVGKGWVRWEIDPDLKDKYKELLKKN